MLIKWLIFIHVLAAFTFYLAHGTSAAMAFQMRKEKDLDRIRALLDLSGTTMNLMFIAFLVMGISGLIMPFLIKIWDKWWIWLSIVLMLLVVVHMVIRSEKIYKVLRRLVGLPYMKGNKQFPAEPPASEQEILAHIQKINTAELVVMGYVAPGFVLWLMVFKPF